MDPVTKKEFQRLTRLELLGQLALARYCLLFLGGMLIGTLVILVAGEDATITSSILRLLLFGAILALYVVIGVKEEAYRNFIPPK